MKTKFNVGDRVRVIDENDEYYGMEGPVLNVDDAGCDDYGILPIYAVDLLDAGIDGFGENELAHVVDREEALTRLGLVDTSAPDSDLDKEHTAFIYWMQKRHNAGRIEYGDKSYSTPTIDSLEDMQEELLDFANYAAYLHGKLERMKQKQIDMVKPLMDQVVMVRGEP